MRLLLLNWRDLGHPTAGGAERYVHELGKRWVAAGHEVTLFSAAFPGASPSDERDGIRIVRAGSRLTVYREAGKVLSRTAGRWDGVVESVNTRPFFAHRVASGAPTLAIFHQLARDVWFYETALPVALVGRFLLEPRWLRRCRDAPAVAVSESTARDLRLFGVRPLAVVPPGTPEPPPEPVPKEPVPTLLFLGRLARSKRPHAAVAAWRILRRSVPDVRMWVAGDGPMRRALGRRARDGLTVFGGVDEATKWELLARAHLVLLPSVREGWGLVVMEAAAVGTPAIGYRVPGLVDSILDGRTGWLCDPRPDAMAAAAAAALRDPDLEAVGKRATLWSSSFVWDAAAEEVLGLVAGGRPPVRRMEPPRARR